MGEDWGINSGKSGTSSLEPEVIRSRWWCGEGGRGRCVKLKTVTEIRQISAHNKFTAECYLVLSSYEERCRIFLNILRKRISTINYAVCCSQMDSVSATDIYSYFFNFI